jgi:hypothetical protein
MSAMNRLKKTFFSAAAATAVAAVFFVARTDRPTARPLEMAQVPPIPSVAPADLASAGFTDPSVLPPSNGRFAAPVKYFRVRESSSNAAWKGEGVSDAVAVYITETPFSAEAVTAWKNVAADISGRAKVCTSRPGIYYCCVGPDRAKCEKLVVALRGK